MSLTFTTSEISKLVPEILALTYFKSPGDDDKGVITANFFPGKGKLLVVTGENANGKSFFRRLLQQAYRQSETKEDIEVMSISLQARAASGNPIRSFIYGDESHNSSGSNSVQTVLTGISTSRARTTPHAIIWDEPDIGLSDAYAAGVGRVIGEYAVDAPELTRAAVVITHRKALVNQLLKAYDRPHHLHLGDNPPEPLESWTSLDDWMAQEIVPKDPELLRDADHQMFLAIHQMFLAIHQIEKSYGKG